MPHDSSMSPAGVNSRPECLCMAVIANPLPACSLNTHGSGE